MPLYVGSRQSLLTVPVVASAPALGTPTFIAEAHVTTATNTLTLPVPSGTADNDVLIAGIVWISATATITPPAGWTLVQETTDGSNYRLRTYYRTASSEPASYAWTTSPTATATGLMASYRDCLFGSPLDGAGTTNTGSGGTATATGITATNNNTMLVMVAGTAGNRSFSASALTELYDAIGAGGSMTFGYFHGLQATAGASGNKTATLNSAATWGAQLLAIKPSGGV